MNGIIIVIFKLKKKEMHRLRIGKSQTLAEQQFYISLYLGVTVLT